MVIPSYHLNLNCNHFECKIGLLLSLHVGWTFIHIYTYLFLTERRHGSPPCFTRRTDWSGWNVDKCKSWPEHCQQSECTSLRYNKVITVLQANRTPLDEAVWHRHKSVIHYFVEVVKVDTTNMTKVITQCYMVTYSCTLWVLLQYIKQWMERQLEEYKKEPKSPGKLPDYGKNYCCPEVP